MERLLLVGMLTAVIHLINTLIYAVRVAGVRTGRLATALSMFNVIFLLSSTANMIQGPLLATIVETAIMKGGQDVSAPAYRDQLASLNADIRLVILAATLGTVLGALLIPYFVKIFIRAIAAFGQVGSVPRLFLMLVFTPRKLKRLSAAHLPEPPAGRGSFKYSGIPRVLLGANVLVTGIFTTGVLSALYAGALYPDYRVAATLMASIVNGVAQVLFATVVDPAAARITDQALQRERAEGDVRRMAYQLAATRLAGTLLAQLIFIPAAYIIRFAAVIIT
jgi:Protein of unknown function (DUF2837).